MSNLALYQLSGQLQQIAQQLADEGFDEATISDTLESLSGDFEDKARQVVSIARNFEALAAQIKEAEQQMAARRKALERRTARMREYVLREMQAVGIEAIDSPWFRISVARNPESVDIFDPNQVPADYWIDPPPPEKVISKELVKKAIKDGYDVPGAKLSRGYRLSVK